MKRLRLLLLLAASLGGLAMAQDPVAALPEHRRGTEQTFLTYPEWFLVHSPAEYAAYVKNHGADGFPFWGHIGQFWGSYSTVTRAASDYPFNTRYHVMIMVIGTSTTVEYALRSAYETLIGRLSALTSRDTGTAEDRLAAKVAQDYVDFIRVKPWYEFDFTGALRQLWLHTDYAGPNMLRKWERRYALTTEYGIKAGYAWLIKKATRASYDVPLEVTAVLIERPPAGADQALAQMKVLQRYPDGAVLALAPRYEAFGAQAVALAAAGADFREIAGNRSVILVSALVPQAWLPQPGDRLLFTQPILTRPGEKRIALVVPVAALSASLRRLAAPGLHLEHVYDY